MISFTDYWVGLSPSEKKHLADAVLSSIPYMSQIAHGHRVPSRRLVFLLEKETGQTLTFPECCED